MKNLYRRRFARCLAIVIFTIAPAIPSSPSPTEKPDVLLSTMQDELSRAQSSLGKLDPAPYFLSYSVYDQRYVMAVGSEGQLVNSFTARRRAGDVTMRIGANALDNSHAQNRMSARTSGTLP